MSKLYHGDNLDVFRQRLMDQSVDLVYLDPPFNSGVKYKVLYGSRDAGSSSQVEAFDDIWHWNEAAARQYDQVVGEGGEVAEALRALRGYLGESGMQAYLSNMAPRFRELRRVMKDSASIYLHCDPTASYYLKMLMDAVFGPEKFRNEIIWHYGLGGRAPSDRFSKKHDVILFYAKTDDVVYTKPVVNDETAGRVDDVWDIPALAPTANERLGYPTQKPEMLLERIIRASSREGDVVLDPFCGSGTALSAAEKLNRQWIGIDATQLAINCVKTRFREDYGDQRDYDVIGEPASPDEARELAQEDPDRFKLWVLGLLNAQPETSGTDECIDGRRAILDKSAPEQRQEVICSVKSGQADVKDVRYLADTISRKEAGFGVLIMLHDPTPAMKSEVESAGTYRSWGDDYPRIQLRSIEELLDGRKLQLPPFARDIT